VLIECLIRRAGGSLVEISGVSYAFKPDASGRHVADVASAAHAVRLLEIAEGYRRVDDEAEPPPAPPPSADKPDVAKPPRGTARAGTKPAAGA